MVQENQVNFDLRILRHAVEALDVFIGQVGGDASYETLISCHASAYHPQACCAQ